MLGDIDAGAILAVTDLERARRFYTETLGLAEAGREGEELVRLRSGQSTIAIYRSQFAGTNQATALSWAVDDVKGTVAALQGKGVRFEHYDMPGFTLEGDVHVGHGMKAAWFKDPDGNILNVVGA